MTKDEIIKNLGLEIRDKKREYGDLESKTNAIEKELIKYKSKFKKAKKILFWL